MGKVFEHTRFWGRALPVLAAACLFLAGCAQSDVQSASASAYRGRGPVVAEGAAHDAFRLVNEERVRRGLLPLERRARIDAVALEHCRDLLAMNRLSHVSSDGRKLENRLGSVNWVRAGENLARNKGFESPPDEAVRGWIASPRHYENMFRSDFSQTGMAALYDPESGFTYIVQVFVVPA